MKEREREREGMRHGVQTERSQIAFLELQEKQKGVHCLLLRKMCGRERERAWPDCSVRAVLEKQQTKEYAFGRQNGRDRPRVIRYIQIAL